MPPVINLTTSIIGYPQYEPWEYLPYATGLDNSVSPQYQAPAVINRALPTCIAASTTAISSATYASGDEGVGATLTASSNGEMGSVDGITPSVGDLILVKDQSTSAHNGIYRVTDMGGVSTPWVMTRHEDHNTAAKIPGGTLVQGGSTNGGKLYLFRVAAGVLGSTPLAIVEWKNHWVANGLPEGLKINPCNGRIYGAATKAGVYNVALRVTTDGGSTWSDPMVIAMGIEPRAGSAGTATPIYVDIETGAVRASLESQSAAQGEPMFKAMVGDQRIYHVVFHRGGTVVDLGDLDALEIGVKEYEPEGLLIMGGGTEMGVGFSKLGGGSETRYPMYVEYSEVGLAVVADYEEDVETYFDAILSIKWIEPNTSGIGEALLRRSSGLFRARVSRNLVP